VTKSSDAGFSVNVAKKRPSIFIDGYMFQGIGYVLPATMNTARIMAGGKEMLMMSHKGIGGQVSSKYMSIIEIMNLFSCGPQFASEWTWLPNKDRWCMDAPRLRGGQAGPRP